MILYLRKGVMSLHSASVFIVNVRPGCNVGARGRTGILQVGVRMPLVRNEISKN